MPKITVNENICKGCEMCVNACPKHIIALDRQRINSKGYHPAKLMEPDKCTGCKSCATMCPDVAITVEV
jgi:2-oxoglutarate ferredoxin oxidoreductase subunit delta